MTMSNNVSAQKEQHLRDLHLSAKLYKPCLYSGLILLIVAIIIFSTCDMAHIASGFLGIPTVEYTGAFWAFLVFLFFGFFGLILAIQFRSAKNDYNRVVSMTNEEFSSYLNKRKAKIVAKMLFKFWS